MARGEKTGGRKVGSRNKQTRAKTTAQLAALVAKELGIDAFDGDAHALLMLGYKHKGLPLEQRIECARAAIGFEKPRLASLMHSGPDGGPIEHRIAGAKAELDAALARLAERIGETGVPGKP